MGKNLKPQKKEDSKTVKLLKKILIPALIGIVCFLVYYFVMAPYLARVLEWKAYDLMVALRNRQAFSAFQAPTHRRDRDIVVVPVDDLAFKKIDEPTFFWTPYYAMVIENLIEGGAKTVSLDFQFSISSDEYLNEKIVNAAQKMMEEKKLEFDEEEIVPFLEKDDQKFFIALRKGKNKVIMMSYIKSDKSYGKPYTPYAYGVGLDNLALVNTEPDEDGIIRKQFLLKTDKDGESHKVFALKTAERFLGKEAVFKDKNSPVFCYDEVILWDTLVDKLKKHESKETEAIWNLFGEETQAEISNAKPSEMSVDFKLKIINLLNAVVLSPPVYSPEVFDKSKLPASVISLVDKGTEDLSPEETMRLNRLLLETVFPYSLSKMKDWKNKAVYLGENKIPVNDNFEMMINYIGPSGTFSKGYSFGELVEKAKAGDKAYFRRRFKGKAVLIGPGYSGSTDILNTPYNVLKYPEMFGIEGHANVLNTILNRDFVRSVNPQVNFIIAILFSIVVAYACYYMKPAWSVLSAFILVLVFAMAGVFIFYNYNLWMNIATPIGQIPLTFGITYAIKYITSDRKRRFIRQVLGRYVSEQVAGEIMKDPAKLELGGERTDVTILFCDINDFTTMSEKKDPIEIINILNDYFDRMEKVIFKHGGTLKQFVGDEIMVITGAPQPNPDHAFQMIKIALDMVKELKRWREVREKAGLESFDVKFGIHSGKVVAGNVGTARRMEYTTVGDVVNTTSRIMGLTKKFKARVLISEETYNRVKERVAVEKKGSSSVKGRESEVVVYELKGLKPWGKN